MPTSSQQNAYYGAQSTGVGVLYDALGNTIATGINMPTGAASGYVLASDANGNLTPQANPVIAATNTWAGSNTWTGYSQFNVGPVLFGCTLAVPEGTNAYMGTVAVNGTTAVTVATTAITGNSRIFMTINVPGGTPGSPYVFSQSAATNFTIKSQASDTSTVAWLIVNHT